MEGDRLSGGIAPLICKLGSTQIWVFRLVCTGHFTVREKALDFIELEAGWVLELVWMFWTIDSSIAPAKIWTPDLPVYILVILLTVLLPDSDLKIIQHSVLLNLNGSFGLDELDLWLEFLEGFFRHGNFPWSSVKGNLLYCIMSNIFSWWKWGDWF